MGDRIPAAFDASSPGSIAMIDYFLDVLDPYVVGSGGHPSWRNSIEAPEGQAARAMRGVARMFVGGAVWANLSTGMRTRPAARMLESEAWMVRNAPQAV